MIRTIWTLLLLCALIAGLPRVGLAAQRKLLIVVVDKVTWHDLLADDVRAPALRRLAVEGAPGMMCVRAARGFGGEYATLGAGSRAASRMDPVSRTTIEANAFQATERLDGAAAAQEFVARTGWPVGDNAIVHLGIGELIRQNQEALYPLRLGLLGETLRRAGIRVACVGNADTLRARHREAVAIAMDEHGLVPLGDIGDGLMSTDRDAPHGLTFDLTRARAAVGRLSRLADIIVLDPGETTRADEAAEWMTPQAAAAARRRAIEKTDRLLGLVLSALPRPDWSVLLVTPSVRSPERNEAFAALAPVSWWPADSPSALLTSPSTRRPGLVVNTDVAATVLAYFGLPIPGEMVGRAFAPAATQGGALERLHADLARHAAMDRLRPQLSRAIPVIGAIALWLSAVLMLIGQSAPGAVRALARGLLVLALSAPPAMLLVVLPAVRPARLAQLLNCPELTAIAVTVVGLSLIIAFLSGWLTRWSAGYGPASLLLVGLLAYDLLRGQQLLYWSPLSYSPAAGARFYGIGNEFAGALLGSALIAAAWLLPPRARGSGCGAAATCTGRALIGLLVLVLALLVGLPGYGANLGMSLSLGVAAAVLCLSLWRHRLAWPELLAAAVAVLALIAAALALDYLRSGPETSHIGRWIAALHQQGWPAAVSVAVRKLSMNLMLLRTSLWTDAAVAALAVLLVTVAARPAEMLTALKERSWATPAIISGLAGAAAACLLNDSGIVAAACALIYLAGSLAYLALQAPDHQL